MGRRRTVQLGTGADRLARRSPGLPVLVAPVVVAALALMAVGAGRAELVAGPSGLAPRVPEWIAVEAVVWIGAPVVVGTMLPASSAAAAPLLALLALAVLTCVASVRHVHRGTGRVHGRPPMVAPSPYPTARATSGAVRSRDWTIDRVRLHRNSC